MSNIKRIKTNNRMSQIVIHNDTIYLAGQVGNLGDSVAEQTKTCLEKVELLLNEAGSDKTRILQTTIWLADISDFANMNEVWDAWIKPGTSPARACGEAKLAKPGLKIEVTLVAARK
jgi:enamine deaminase RidA (YjgF/YER057c/UK114 family)|tara:strand:+ start:318 stop:668 length:351 start_codon:yes stop_codon:yes gene_type:complete